MPIKSATTPTLGIFNHLDASSIPSPIFLSIFAIKFGFGFGVVVDADDAGSAGSAGSAAFGADSSAAGERRERKKIGQNKSEDEENVRKY